MSETNPTVIFLVSSYSGLLKKLLFFYMLFHPPYCSVEYALLQQKLQY